LAQNRPASHLAPLIGVIPFEFLEKNATDRETSIFVAADSEDFMIIA